MRDLKRPSVRDISSDMIFRTSATEINISLFGKKQLTRSENQKFVFDKIKQQRM
jgi:hypothetical protein